MTLHHPSRARALLVAALAIGSAPSAPGANARAAAPMAGSRRSLAGTTPAPAPQDTVADRAALAKKIDAILATTPISSGLVSIEVRALADGQLVYAKNANDQLNPASNTKVVTAAAALLRLGPEYRFSTDVLTDSSYAHGKARTLFVKGRGDPTVTTERLESIARDLAHRGLVQIGDLVLDDSYFDDQIWGPGWDTETSDKSYAAGVSALSLNRNSVGIYVRPGDHAGANAHIELDPEAHGFFELVNKVVTVKEAQRRRLLPHTFSSGDHTRVVVSGRIPLGDDSAILYRRVTEPTFYFGAALKQMLLAHGIHMTGSVRRGLVTSDAKLLASYDSSELGEVVRDMNKASSNFIAEMLLKTLGAELQGAPGTWPKGVDAIEGALADLGLPKQSYQLKNGSGLNDTNRISSHQLVVLLTALYSRFPLAAEFIASLPVAARDGSLRLRMDGTEAAGHLRAKTGTLDRAVALSGFLQTVSGEQLVFSILVNDWAGKVAPIQMDADKVGALLASLGARPTDQLAQSVQAAAAELPPVEQLARITGYKQLALARDKKNVAQLRAAVRTEADPLVRLMAADALFRSDAESGTGALLDAYPLGSDLLNKLRAVAGDVPMPVVPSLLDLAAEGNPDAFARLLFLSAIARSSPPSPGDPALARVLAEGLADVSEAAPDETLTAFRTAPPEQARAAAELLGAGFAATNVETDDSSFAQLVLAAAARSGLDSIEPRIWIQLIERRGLHNTAVNGARDGGGGPESTSASGG